MQTEVFLQEVGPRDGLQNEKRVLSVFRRAELVDSLVSAGFRRIQIGSFVNPAIIPQMAETDRVWELINKRPGVRYSVLVLNRKGLDSALKHDIPHVEVYVSASETHSLNNSGKTIEKALASCIEIIRLAKEAERTVTAGIMCAFGCVHEGEPDSARIVRILESLNDQGPDEIGLADTTGMAVPEKIKRTLEEAAKIAGMDRLSLHLHDTFGHGYENLFEALNNGVNKFDVSIGGLGGCPFIPGAKGNISTEKTLALLKEREFSVLIDLETILETKRRVNELLGLPCDREP